MYVCLKFDLLMGCLVQELVIAQTAIETFFQHVSKDQVPADSQTKLGFVWKHRVKDMTFMWKLIDLGDITYACKKDELKIIGKEFWFDILKKVEDEISEHNYAVSRLRGNGPRESIDSSWILDMRKNSNLYFI